MQPYNWEDIVRRSKLANQATQVKERTFITHMNLALWTKEKVGFNTDGSRIKIPKAQQNKPAPKKKTSKIDEKQEQMIEILEMMIKYMTKLRQYPYVCQTEKKNLLGIRVINQFYVDELGCSFSDAES